MIKFTSFLIKRAKNSSVIPYSDFLAIARGKEGKLLDFFLSVKDTGLFELSNEGLKVVATPEELAVFKRETYKISPPFTNFKKYSIFDLNRKAKRFSLLSLRILDYVKNNIGCDLNDSIHKHTRCVSINRATLYLVPPASIMIQHMVKAVKQTKPINYRHYDSKK